MTKHYNCSLSEALEGQPCAAGDPATCPAHAAAERRRQAMSGLWSPLEARRGDGDERHYLDGEPIHCGAMLELQAVEVAADDYGDYTVVQQRGLPVRYELAAARKGAALDKRGVLYADIGGHSFAAGIDEWWRFRWPESRRRDS